MNWHSYVLRALFQTGSSWSIFIWVYSCKSWWISPFSSLTSQASEASESLSCSCILSCGWPWQWQFSRKALSRVARLTREKTLQSWFPFPFLWCFWGQFWRLNLRKKHCNPHFLTLLETNLRKNVAIPIYFAFSLMFLRANPGKKHCNQDFLSFSLMFLRTILRTFLFSSILSQHKSTSLFFFDIFSAQLKN